MSPHELARDVLARIAAAREEFEPAVAEQILEELELDVAAWLETHPEPAA